MWTSWAPPSLPLEHHPSKWKLSNQKLVLYLSEDEGQCLAHSVLVKTGKWTHLPEAGGVPGFADGPVQPLVGSNVVSTALTSPGIFTCTQNRGVQRLKKQGVRGQDPYLLEEYGVNRLWCWKG